MLSLIATLVVALAGSLRVLVRDSGRRFLPVFNIELVVACDDGSFGATVGMHVSQRWLRLNERGEFQLLSRPRPSEPSAEPSYTSSGPSDPVPPTERSR